MLKKGDIILVISLLLAIVIGFMGIKVYKSQSLDKIAVIKQNDKVLQTIDLNTVTKQDRIEITGKYAETILVEKGRIRFEKADCPDQVCVKTGWLSNRGEVAVCLPNRTIIIIEGEKDKVDGVTF